MVSISTLRAIAAYGGVIVVGTGLYLQSCLRDQIKSSDLYKSAFKTLRTHAGAVQLLGEPIKDGKITLDDSESFCDGFTARYQIPVSGQNDKGIYYFWADKEEEKWVIKRAELGLKSDPNKRLVIVKDMNKETEKKVD